MKRVRQDHSTARVVPAQQRLDSGHHLGSQIDCGLVDEEQLPKLDRVAEIISSSRRSWRNGLHLRLEQHEPIPPRFLAS